MREVLGKPAVVFMPSGTMAQQIAIRIHADKRAVRTFAFHPTAHLELHEDKAYQRLHGLVGIPIGNARRPLTLDDLSAVHEPVAAVLFELPQREIGGQLPRVGGPRTAGRDRARPRRRRAPGRRAHLGVHAVLSANRRPTSRRCSTPYTCRSTRASAVCPAAVSPVKTTSSNRRARGALVMAGPCSRSGPMPHPGSRALRKRLPLMPAYYAHARAIADALRDNEKHRGRSRSAADADDAPSHPRR